MLIPEDEGGLGLGVLDYCLVSEELARAWTSVGSIIARGNGTGRDSADPQRRLQLRRAGAPGRRIRAIAFSEPLAGSHLANVACAAVREGDEWVVTGTKRWVGRALSADFLHLLARTRPPRDERGPSDGLELFLVEKARGAFPDGVTGEPIGNQQAIRHMLADMSSDIAAARQLYQHAAWLVDSGEPATVETSRAKLFASEMAERVTSQALQVFVGNGYTTEYAVERYWRDARLTKIFEGTSETQRRIIGDGLLEDAPA